MSEHPVEASPSDAFDALLEVLADVRRPGDFFATGRAETPMPSMRVEGVGTISFPVPPAQARELIDRVAERAPYGKGAATLVDETVRKVWQVTPAQIQISGTGWTATLNWLVAQVAQDLGCQDAEVTAELYKLLIYEAGDFFVSHRDSEKTAGMFATLVVALPSEHDGGTLLVRHAGREAAIDLGGSEAGEIRYAAFYADCEHEIRPIVSGYRVCLVFNLVQRPKTGQALLVAPDRREAVAACAERLKQWARRKDAPRKMVYLLEHQYTQAGLSFAALKNGDAAQAQVLREAAAQAQCALHLGMVHIEESGAAEYSASGWHGRYWEHDHSGYEAGEVFDRNCHIAQWRDIDDGQVDFGEMPFDDEELLPPGALDDEEPDELHFSEATGNAGADFERTYLRAALVLWPHARFDEICLSAGIDAALTRMQQLLAAAGQDAVSRADGLAAAARLARLIAARWQPDGRREGTHLARLLRDVLATDDADLIEELISTLLLERYDGLQNEALAACTGVLGRQRSTRLLAALFDRHGPLRPAPCIDLWLRLAQAADADTALIETLATSLIPQLAACKQEDRRRHHYLFPGHEAWIRQDEMDDAVSASNESQESNPARMSPELAADFLILLHERGFASLQAEAGAGMIANARVFAPERIVLPALERISVRGPGRASAVFEPLWRYCAEHYLARSERPPAPPQDWAQPIDLPCSCGDCRELQAFARDPEAQTYRFRVREDRRRHLEQQIRTANLDMSPVTERKGSPYVLVCSKTRASYERALKQYHKDRTDIGRLAALSEASPPRDTCLLARLRAALAVPS